MIFFYHVFHKNIGFNTTVLDIENNTRKLFLSSKFLKDHVTLKTEVMLQIQLFHHRNKYILKYIQIEKK